MAELCFVNRQSDQVTAMTLCYLLHLSVRNPRPRRTVAIVQTAAPSQKRIEMIELLIKQSRTQVFCHLMMMMMMTVELCTLIVICIILYDGSYRHHIAVPSIDSSFSQYPQKSD